MNLVVKKDTYEGGLVIWEGSAFLVQYLMAERRKDLFQKRVLEIGCGHGKPGTAALKAGATFVWFQDLNPEVGEMLQQELSEDNWGFISGKWSNLVQCLERKDTECNSSAFAKFRDSVPMDIVLASEVTYRPERFDDLLDLFTIVSSPETEIIVCSKRHYFGLGGGSLAFQAAAEDRGFRVRVVESVVDGVSSVRDVLVLYPPKKDTSAMNPTCTMLQ